ncbi:hypothetical protein K501DRAFT_270125 [Backusella circina FSU 941]|nr:hypothetical protein K501DRAFT_270125 [Backusella circina FSU 941]
MSDESLPTYAEFVQGPDASSTFAAPPVSSAPSAPKVYPPQLGACAGSFKYFFAVLLVAGVVIACLHLIPSFSQGTPGVSTEHQLAVPPTLILIWGTDGEKSLS